MDHLEVADRFMNAIVSGDVDAIRQEVYAPGARIFHNTSRSSESVEENLVVLRWVSKHVRNLRYEAVSREATPAGFVQQHVLRGTAPDGAELDVPACLVATVEHGRITVLAEYMDSAHIRPLMPTE